MSLQKYLKDYMDTSILNEPIVQILIEACENGLECGLGECGVHDIINYIELELEEDERFQEQFKRAKEHEECEKRERRREEIRKEIDELSRKIEMLREEYKE